MQLLHLLQLLQLPHLPALPFRSNSASNLPSESVVNLGELCMVVGLRCARGWEHWEWEGSNVSNVLTGTNRNGLRSHFWFYDSLLQADQSSSASV